MAISVKTTKKGNGYLAIAKDLKQKVADGVYRPGQRLSTVKEMAAEYSVSIETASRGVQVLKKAGILKAKPGSGIFVCEPHLENALAETLTFLASWPADNGLSSYTEYSEAFSAPLLHGIQDEALTSNIRNQIVLIPSAEFEDSRALLKRIRPHLASQQGGIVVNSAISGEVARSMRDYLPFPLCFANAWMDSSFEVNVVRIDRYRAARRIIDHLLQAGHRRIGCIGIDPKSRSARHFKQRRMAYRNALKDHGISYDPKIVWEPHSNYIESIEKSCRELLSLPQSKRPSAVFCFNDFRALALLRIAGEMDMNVPDDISIAGFDGTPQALAEGIATVHFPTYQAGMMAMTTLKSIVLGRAPQPMATTIEGGAILGRTVKIMKDEK